MPVEQYGTTQVHEMRFTQAEVQAIVLENIQARACPSYDFDFRSPIMLVDPDGTLIFRFVQKTITSDSNSRKITLKTMPSCDSPKQKTIPQ